MTSVLAFVLGLGASFAAFASSESVTTSDRAGLLLGNADPNSYCRTRFGDTAAAILVASNADGWRCFASANRLVSSTPIDFDDVCTTQFEERSYAQSRDPKSAYSWVCRSGSAP